MKQKTITSKDLFKAIEKNFKVKLNGTELDEPIRHSSICFEIRKNYLQRAIASAQLMQWVRNGLKKEEAPFTNSIHDVMATHFVICKNYNTGINLFKRKSLDYAEKVKMGCLEVDKVKIKGESFYLIWD